MNEILDANGLGAAVKRREDTHKMAESNRPRALPLVTKHGGGAAAPRQTPHTDRGAARATNNPARTRQSETR